MSCFSFFGTVKRKEYWLTSLLYFVLAFISIFMLLNEATMIPGLAFTMLVVWLGLALTTKRVRDTGCSCWFVIVYSLIAVIPYIGFIGQVIWMCLPTDFFDRYKK